MSGAIIFESESQLRIYKLNKKDYTWNVGGTSWWDSGPTSRAHKLSRKIWSRATPNRAHGPTGPRAEPPDLNSNNTETRPTGPRAHELSHQI